jgi:hypothetical protein
MVSSFKACSNSGSRGRLDILMVEMVVGGMKLRVEQAMRGGGER